MVIGLKAGTELEGRDEAKEWAYELIRTFAEGFEKRNGSIVCNDLLGHDISTLEGRKKASEEGLFETLCPELVRSAAEILEAIL
jgi:hypothetical protein